MSVPRGGSWPAVLPSWGGVSGAGAPGLSGTAHVPFYRPLRAVCQDGALTGGVRCVLGASNTWATVAG
ncbi:MAG: hypothetical protein ACYC3U_03305, partial [Georgenia sp.]